eukprot:UN06255
MDSYVPFHSSIHHIPFRIQYLFTAELYSLFFYSIDRTLCCENKSLWHIEFYKTYLARMPCQVFPLAVAESFWFSIECID